MGCLVKDKSLAEREFNAKIQINVVSNAVAVPEAPVFHLANKEEACRQICGQE